jgi:ABC-type nitrate/sulfonate/bicarbonate transport system substrate-binding protein
LNKSFASQHGITPAMSLNEEFGKLKGTGANVGVLDIGGSGQLAFAAMAKHYGLKEGTDYHFTAIKSYPSLIVALSRGEVDLVVFGMPYGSEAVVKGDAQNAGDLWKGSYKPFAGAEWGVVFTTANFAKTHPSTVKKMYTATNDALRFIHTHPQQALKDINAADPGTPMSVLTSLIVTSKGEFLSPSATIGPSTYAITQRLASAAGAKGVSAVKYSSLIWPGAQVKGSGG